MKNDERMKREEFEKEKRKGREREEKGKQREREERENKGSKWMKVFVSDEKEKRMDERVA